MPLPARVLLTLVIAWCAAAAQTPPPAPEPPEPPAIATDDVTPDDQIRERLESIFSALEGFEDLELEVNSGVVTLGGQVTGAKTATEALELARRTTDVVYVRDRIEQAVDVEARITPAITKARELSRAAIRKLPLLGIAIAVMAATWLLGTWLSKRLGLFRRLGLSELSANLAQRLVRLIFIAIGLIVALEILDATALAGAFLGVAGVMGIALGFAFRNIVENYLAGILLSMRNPFTSGDFIEIEGFTGMVVSLTSRDTLLMTLEGNHLRIPNRNIMTSVLINYTRNPLRRFDFAVGISVEQDLVAVRELALETLETLPGVLSDPRPRIIVEELGESTVNLRFHAWIDQTRTDFIKARSEAIRLIKEKFDQVGIEMPEPIYRLHMTGPKAPAIQETETPPCGPKRRGNDEIDTAVDLTIEKQIETAGRNEQEPDLLK